MSRFCSVHTHSTMCDGKDTLSDMAWAAWQAGAVSFGASGHSHTPIPQDQEEILPADLSVYRDQVLRLRETYRGRMDVLLGIEMDNCADVTAEGLDYWIGSVHHVPMPDGIWAPVDYDVDSFAACQAACGGDGYGMVERYYGEVAAMAARKPTILGHLDLIVKFNSGGAFFDEASPRYRSTALEALRCVDPEATLLEINTGAMARGYRDTPYPDQFLLRQWRDMGGRIILTADAHSASTIVYGYREASLWAQAAGFTQAALLTLSGTESCPL